MNYQQEKKSILTILLYINVLSLINLFKTAKLHLREDNTCLPFMVIFAKLINLVSLEQFHQKPMGMTITIHCHRFMIEFPPMTQDL